MFVNFVWAIGGIVVGYIAGVIATRPDSSRLPRTLAGLVILIIVTLSAILNYTNSVALANSVRCQRQFNSGYRGSLQSQLDAGRLESQAQHIFINAFRSADVPPAERDRLFDNYLRKLDEAERLRAEHPLPVENICGGPGE